MTRKERLVLIEKFRKGNLEGLALQRFEKLLEEDQQLSRELELVQEMSEALDDHSDYNLFYKLVLEAEKKYFMPKKARFWPPAKVAAAVAFLLVAGAGIWWFSIPSSSPEQLFEKHFQAYPAPSNFRGDQLMKLDEDFMMGLVRYEDQEYGQAIVYFEKALERDSANYTARFLSGVSYMAQKNFTRAETIFLDMVEDNSHLFQDQCRWYLGLLYVSDDNPDNDEKSKFYLEGITNESLKKELK